MKAHRLVPGGSYTHIAQALWNRARVGLICKAIWQQKQNTLQLQTKFGRCQLLRAVCSGRKLKSSTSDSVCCLWHGVAHSLKRTSLAQRQCRNGRERAPNLHERESWRHTQLPIDHIAKNRAVECYNCFLHTAGSQTRRWCGNKRNICAQLQQCCWKFLFQVHWIHSDSEMKFSTVDQTQQCETERIRSIPEN